MSYAALPASIRQTAEQHLTPKQLEAWQHEVDGLSLRRIAIELDISRPALADRLTGAYRTLRSKGVTQDAHGTWAITPPEPTSGAEPPKPTLTLDHTVTDPENAAQRKDAA